MSTKLIPIEKIEKSIYLIRGEKVMLDRDLAMLYGVATHSSEASSKTQQTPVPRGFYVCA